MEDTKTWEFYEYLENHYTIFNPESLTTDDKDKNFNLFPCPLLPYGLASWYFER